MKKKILIIAMISLIIVIIWLILYFIFKPQKIIVFTYHKVVPLEIKNTYYKDDPWIDTTERFEEQIKYLYDKGYNTISMDEYYNWKNGKIELPKKQL